MLPVLLAAGLVVLLLGSLRELRGTTLIAPWAWSIVAVVAVGAAEAWAASREPGDSRLGPLQYLAGALALCPAIAVLGAKRPQDSAWTLIVLTCWLVLALPAIRALLLDRSATFAVDGGLTLFVIVLAVVGTGNYLPTRHWGSALLVGVAQGLLLARFLALPARRDAAAADDGWGMPGFAGARVSIALVLVGLAVLLARRRRRHQSRHVLDQWWFDFRDSFGSLWALRLAEQINSAAMACGWHLRLRWSGFAADARPGLTPDPPGEMRDPPEETRAVLRQAMENILRRFVSANWLVRREILRLPVAPGPVSTGDDPR